MKFITTTLLLLASTANGLWGKCFGRHCADKCRCEGRWELVMDSWIEHQSGGSLKALSRPIQMDIWPLENGDPLSVRLSMHVANTVGVVVTAKGGDFCDKEVEIQGGSFSTQMFPFGAAAHNEKRLTKLLLEQLDSWDCTDHGKLLTLSSPLAQVKFIPFQEELIVASD